MAAPPNMPEPGYKYRIQNLGYNTVVDMRYGVSAEKNPVVGWVQGSLSNPHQIWELEIVDPDTKKVTLKNIASRTYARVFNEIKGEHVVGSSEKGYFILHELGVGIYRIENLGRTLCCSLNSGDNDQPIILDNLGTEMKKKWAFQLFNEE